MVAPAWMKWKKVLHPRTPQPCWPSGTQPEYVVSPKTTLVPVPPRQPVLYFSKPDPQSIHKSLRWAFRRELVAEGAGGTLDSTLLSIAHLECEVQRRLMQHPYPQFSKESLEILERQEKQYLQNLFDIKASAREHSQEIARQQYFQKQEKERAHELADRTKQNELDQLWATAEAYRSKA
eukprot:NODE_5589_length_636_cov_16.866405_g5425_i0.p1 GENE.NODE_5589_length_636_cov_16.866405_g5425_i0~~NODE_5589_length_636_cov_16.866405_g5425_i0.p1  ORF type:complete len:197 (-),score=58.91 NODE_5589_length_636_cov_16.866405_g5425_i0:45-581(-)